MNSVYKVYCEFFVKANDRRDVANWCMEDSDFVEKHIFIERIDTNDIDYDSDDESNYDIDYDIT